MAEKKKSSSSSKKTVTKTTNTWSSTKILDCIAYFAIMFIAIALLLQVIFKGNVSVADAFQEIGECIAYIVAIWLGFYWTRRKRNIWWLICWIIATVLIVVLYICSVAL